MNLDKEHVSIMISAIDEKITKTKDRISTAMSHKDSTLKDYEEQVDILTKLRYIRETIQGDKNV